jgi:isopentenyl diphosphate isomerase/L-lactate dehydrogenase-like FMN-dependent dehydrogenase
MENHPKPRFSARNAAGCIATFMSKFCDKMSYAFSSLAAGGVDDDATLRANREGYGHIQLRPRRLRDATFMVGICQAKT